MGWGQSWATQNLSRSKIPFMRGGEGGQPKSF